MTEVHAKPKHFGCILTAVPALMLSALPSVSQDLTGYCLDNIEAGCMDRYLPFYEQTIDFCEETCTLTNPVPVRDMDAVLYDFVCQADYPSPFNGRVMLLRQTDWNEEVFLSLIDERETRSIVPCP